MTPYPWFDVLAIAGLILLNGLFSMSELAIVSARPARLKVAAENGSSGAKVALELAEEPGKFLSTVQIGITLVGIIAGAYSGSSLGGPTGERLALLGVPERFADDAGFALVIAITTYGSLVAGELVPKQLALRAAEPIAMIASRPMALLAKVAAPLVWLLRTSSDVLLRLFGQRQSSDQQVTVDELHLMFAEATRSGVIEEDERQIMSGIMRLAERPVRDQTKSLSAASSRKVTGNLAPVDESQTRTDESSSNVAMWLPSGLTLTLRTTAPHCMTGTTWLPFSGYESLATLSSPPETR